MNRAEVIERLCALVSRVGELGFNSHVSHDCFCGGRAFNEHIKIDDEVVEFIETTVDAALKGDL